MGTKEPLESFEKIGNTLSQSIIINYADCQSNLQVWTCLNGSSKWIHFMGHFPFSDFKKSHL